MFCKTRVSDGVRKRKDDVRCEEMRKRLALLDMAHLYRRDLIIKERARNASTLMLDLYALLCRIPMSLTQIPLEMRNAILVAIDLLPAERLELRRHNLKEVLEHVLRFARAREVPVARVRLDT